MLFNSLQFLFFFLIVTFLYFLSPYRYRWIILLAASCYFYMAFVPIYILILGFTIVIDYLAGIYIERSIGLKRKFLLVGSLISNIGVLAIFKYYNFINENITTLYDYFGFHNTLPFLKILLPIGLSFHTFQAMSYTIEVYRGNQKAEKHFGIYSLYVMFYPQLVAGPIERPQNLIHQFYEKHNFEYENVISGLKQMLWGLFKKIVIADRLSIYVNAVYNNANQHNGNTFIIATVLFSFQIYCDFSGYSDIAIGAARIMGFKLMTNFRSPYFSKTISEFWKRWHISLSTWFQDYLYFPLGGNRVSKTHWYFNLFIVFLLSGLWHGANWTYIAWGALNGFYLVFAIISTKLRNKISNYFGLFHYTNANKLFQIITTFLLTSFAWIFFRANNISDAFIIVKKIFSNRGPIFITSPSETIYILLGIIILISIEAKKEFYYGTFSFFNNPSWLIRNTSYLAIILLILLFGVFDGGQFIYFQF